MNISGSVGLVHGEVWSGGPVYGALRRAPGVPVPPHGPPRHRFFALLGLALERPSGGHACSHHRQGHF